MPPMDEMTNQRTMPPSDQPVKASPPPPGSDAPKPKSSSGKMVGVVVVCLLIVGGAVWLARSRAASAEKKAAAARTMELPSVPVVAGTVAQKDVPIYRSEEHTSELQS